jgi:co-chaperonin GroES (HSP10)
MINIRPHRDRVLLELIPEETKRGGIMLPDNAKKKDMRKGRVVSMATDCKQALRIGQTVWAVWNCGVPLELGHANETRIFKSEDVWAMEERSSKHFDLPPQPGRRHA